ncbi:MarR family transcriptional regulator [Allokutzneria sp. A3M-2-11 16]|uniref:MarR family winged helix-turn-helix transcriptional regulator n=1 Tax=Allokutzneria sp. A3M-2-11 16 TaxID=2962043 RepID=UPI0020B77158|nr:MarR family transcriptional regulator [Allokutzneria sp. A3M-2-11 16]MCP3805445.1 MarR family transcriptional regulator [Allokutzneria sp. A3M-2-11 16]
MAEDENTSSTVMLLVVAGRELQRRVDAALGELGLTMRHLGALGHVARNPEVSYSDLARRAGITTQSMRATVLMLEDQGAVRRTLAGHGHPARLDLTDQGRELLAKAKAVISGLDEDVRAKLEPGQDDALRAALARTLEG